MRRSTRSDVRAIKARQGVELITSGELRVVDDEEGRRPARRRDARRDRRPRQRRDGGLLQRSGGDGAAIRGGWFHSGDAAVVHPDGYVEIRDRLKDVIISGGENISSVEVEGVLLRHPAVQEVAVVGLPHEKWGEAPHAFVVLRPGASATEDELRQFARSRLAHFKVPHGDLRYGAAEDRDRQDPEVRACAGVPRSRSSRLARAGRRGKRSVQGKTDAVAPAAVRSYTLAELVQVGRLVQAFTRAKSKRVVHHLRSRRRHTDHGDIRAVLALPSFCEERQAVHDRHHQVQQDDAGTMLSEHAQPLVTVRRDVHVEAPAFQSCTVPALACPDRLR